MNKIWYIAIFSIITIAYVTTKLKTQSQPKSIFDSIEELPLANVDYNAEELLAEVKAREKMEATFSSLPFEEIIEVIESQDYSAYEKDRAIHALKNKGGPQAEKKLKKLIFDTSISSRLRWNAQISLVELGSKELENILIKIVETEKDKSCVSLALENIEMKKLVKTKKRLQTALKTQENEQIRKEISRVLESFK